MVAAAEVNPHSEVSVFRKFVLGRKGHKSPLLDIIQVFVLGGGMAWLTINGANSMGYNWQWYRIPKYFWRYVDGELVWGEFVHGVLVTLEIAAWAVLIAVAVGLLTALFKMSNSMAGRVLASVYLEGIRNTPLLVQIYLMYFVISPIIGIDRLWTGIIALALYEGSFAAEIIRSGIQSVERGQWEASASIGLTQRDTYRYVVLPQAIPIMLPPLTGLFVNLIKHSSIVSVIAIFDLTTEGRNIIADTFLSFEIWFTIAAIYLSMTITLSSVVNYMEYRLRKRSW
jgi:polar amino acid transport system permease protein